MTARYHVKRVPEVHLDGAYIEGDSFDKCGVFAYLTAAADTTCTLKDTYYPIAGTFTNSPIEGFTTTAGPPPGIVYACDEDRTMEIDWHASVVLSTGNDTVHVAVLKNGTEVASSVMGTYVTTLVLQMSGTCAIEMTEDDVITLAVRSGADGTVITFAHFTTTINKFFIAAS